MTCGTGRISRGRNLRTEQDKSTAACQALNEPAVINTITCEEYVEIGDYLGMASPLRRGNDHEDDGA